MAFYLIGLGLHDKKDITVKGLETVKRCSEVYLENYTSKLSCSKEELEEFYGKKIILADRKMVEQDFEKSILPRAKSVDIALLIIGDVFSATTHSALMLEAKKQDVKVHVINNASVLAAVGITGLSLYNFGKTTSVPFDNKDVKAPYDVIKENRELHTLVLLDLNPSENKFMLAVDAIRFLLSVEKKRKEGVFTKDTKCVICADLGSEDPEIAYGSADELSQKNFNRLPQCLLIPGKLHFMEEEFLQMFSLQLSHNH
ncbi:MAG: diphthine synthase [archaeon]